MKHIKMKISRILLFIPLLAGLMALEGCEKNQVSSPVGVVGFCFDHMGQDAAAAAEALAAEGYSLREETPVEGDRVDYLFGLPEGEGEMTMRAVHGEVVGYAYTHRLPGMADAGKEHAKQARRFYGEMGEGAGFTGVVQIAAPEASTSNYLNAPQYVVGVKDAAGSASDWYAQMMMSTPKRYLYAECRDSQVSFTLYHPEYRTLFEQ